MHIRFAYATDTGRTRQRNEDAVRVVAPADGVVGPGGALFVVADGMGGHLGGSVASELAADTVVDGWTRRGGDQPLEALRSAMGRANASVFERAARTPDLRGMGTTCTAMALADDHAWFAHVGDSRAYLVRGDVITQLTRDHSLVEDMVRSGMISHEDARMHPRRNVITRSIGVQERVEVDTPHTPLDLVEGDAFVLCSDGLSGPVADDEIGEVVMHEAPESACRRLVELANARGGRDNISVIVVVVDSLEKGSAP